jgi:hypothetical protein
MPSCRKGRRSSGEPDELTRQRRFVPAKRPRLRLFASMRDQGTNVRL